MRTLTHISFILVFWLLLPAVVSAQIVWEEIALVDTIKTYRIDFDSSGKSFIATNYGLYSSEDGYYWEQTNLTEFVSNVYINENNTIYAGMNKLSRSFDGGETWDSLFYSDPWGLESIFTLGDSIILVGTWGGIYRYTDNNQTWDHVLATNISELFGSGFVSNSFGTIYCGSTPFEAYDNPGGVYKSLDNGVSWELSNMDYHFVSSIAINSNDELFVGTRGHFYTGNSGVFKSIDEGETWTKVFQNYLVASLDINSYNEISIGCANQGPPYGGVFISSDNGLNWNEITNNLQPDDIRKVKFDSQSYLYAITNYENLIYRSQTPVTISDKLFNKTIKPNIETFPNPANNHLNIRLENEEYTNINVVLTTLSGKTIKNILFQTFNTKIDIDISKLKSGIYCIKVYTRNVIIGEKIFIKN